MNFDLKHTIEEKYGLAIRSIIKSDESTAGNVYIIETMSNRYVSKIYHDKKHVISMIKLHTMLAQKNIRAPKVVKTIKNEQYVHVKNRYIVVYTYVNGEKLGNLNLTNNVIEDIAIYLKELHQIVDNTCDLEMVSFDINLQNPFMRKSILHFDVTKNNIFESQSQIVFIDFDDSKYGLSVCDVAIAITNLFITKRSGFDIKGINIFLDKYYENMDELRKIEVPQIKDIAISWIDSILDGNNFDVSIIDGLNNKRNLISKIFNENLIRLKA
ncbi:MAG: phosphotransferase [Clostridia bacterium]|nr:phosphotransferase [Clostridia bacterium]